MLRFEELYANKELAIFSGMGKGIVPFKA